jgi:hypothetical protein
MMPVVAPPKRFGAERGIWPVTVTTVSFRSGTTGVSKGASPQEADMSEDFEYYERRAREEAEAAASSDRPALAAGHRLLALEYAAHAEALRTSDSRREFQLAV